MSKRHQDALAIQRGACNPSGIANSILDACREMREAHYGTQQICNDDALRLMVHQLAFICGVVTGAEEFAKAPGYERAMAECRDKSSGSEPPPS